MVILKGKANMKIKISVTMVHLKTVSLKVMERFRLSTLNKSIRDNSEQGKDMERVSIDQIVFK